MVLQPFAVWLCLRRLVSKVANCSATTELLSTLAPHQLGVGVRGGTEAIVHAARRFGEPPSFFLRASNEAIGKYLRVDDLTLCRMFGKQ